MPAPSPRALPIPLTRETYMTKGEAIYLAFVIVAVVMFGATLAWVSWQSGKD
jgi:hypothetical protein